MPGPRALPTATSIMACGLAATAIAPALPAALAGLAVAGVRLVVLPRHDNRHPAVGRPTHAGPRHVPVRAGTARRHLGRGADRILPLWLARPTHPVLRRCCCGNLSPGRLPCYGFPPGSAIVTRPSRWAVVAASTRLRTPSAARMPDTCEPAVFSVMNNRCAISRLVFTQVTDRGARITKVGEIAAEGVERMPLLGACPREPGDRDRLFAAP